MGSGILIVRALVLPGLGEPCGKDGRCRKDLLCATDVQKCLLPGGTSCNLNKPELCVSRECDGKTQLCALPLGSMCTGDQKAQCVTHSTCDPTTGTCRQNGVCKPGDQQCTPDGASLRICGDVDR